MTYLEKLRSFLVFPSRTLRNFFPLSHCRSGEDPGLDEPFISFIILFSSRESERLWSLLSGVILLNVVLSVV